MKPMSDSIIGPSALRERRPSLSTYNDAFPTMTPSVRSAVGVSSSSLEVSAIELGEVDVVEAEYRGLSLNSSKVDVTYDPTHKDATVMHPDPATPPPEPYTYPPTPASSLILTATSPVKYKRRVASSFAAFFCCGWADGTPGTILPYLETDYGLTYLTVSLLFVAATVGFAIGTILIEPLFNALSLYSLSHPRRRFLPIPQIFSHTPFHPPPPISEVSRTPALDKAHSPSQGRFYTLLLAGLCQIVYFSLAASKPPFYGMLIAFCFGGVGVSMLSGQLNAYIAGSSKVQGRTLGHLHGFYGIGACASPLVCQTLIARGWQWRKFYFISLSFALVNFMIILACFTMTRREGEVERVGELMRRERLETELEMEIRDGENVGGEETGGRAMERRVDEKRSRMRMALSMKYVWIFAVFLCIYTGTETTTGGWIVTFLLRERGANPKTVGYVAAGFWAGLAVGRLVLGQASPYIGIRYEKHLVHIYILLALAMQFFVWFVPSFVGNAVCTGIVGFALGPMFPTSLSLATKILPGEVHMTALAAMSSFASMGSALFPFFTGVLANTKGPRVLQPVMVGLLSIMACLWCLFPARVGHRT